MNALNTRVMRRKGKRAALTRVLEEPLSSSNLKLSLVWKEHKKLNKSACHLRHEFLLEREDKAESEKSKI